VRLQGLGVHLGHHERHLRVQPEIAPVIYHDRAARDGLAGELHRRALLTLGPGEEGKIHALESLRLRDPNLEGFPG
jgi:hypothetical protein